MSGTSLDGIDAALLRVSGTGLGTKFKLLAFETYSFPRGLREFILKNSSPETSRVDDLCRLNTLVGKLYADAVKKIARKVRIELFKVDFIGSHGQTVQHLPRSFQMFGREINATLQLGDPCVIAKETGVLTVGDFRVADMAMGGEGAPLVPYFDFICFRSTRKNRAVLNIGGIANITVLPKKCTIEQVQAFDTGPGNMLIDALTGKFYKRLFDEDGKIAMKGKISFTLLDRLMQHPFLKREPPKSTGREEFGELFLQALKSEIQNLPHSDVIATVTEFTAGCVYFHYQRFIRRKTPLDELLVSGGGVHNQALMASLRKYFHPISVKTIKGNEINSDAKEAICFALLANETLAARQSNIPSATGARKPVILGKICLPD